MGLSRIAFWVDDSALWKSSSSKRILPRFKWASAKLGLSFIALRIEDSASFNLPWALKILLRFK